MKCTQQTGQCGRKHQYENIHEQCSFTAHGFLFSPICWCMLRRPGCGSSGVKQVVGRSGPSVDQRPNCRTRWEQGISPFLGADVVEQTISVLSWNEATLCFFSLETNRCRLKASWIAPKSLPSAHIETAELIGASMVERGGQPSIHPLATSTYDQSSGFGNGNTQPTAWPPVGKGVGYCGLSSKGRRTWAVSRATGLAGGLGWAVG